MKNTCNFVFSFTEDGEPRRAHTQLTGTIPSCWSSAFAFQPFTIWYKREEAIKILLKGIWPRSHFCRCKNRNLHTSSTQRQFDDSVLRFLPDRLRSGSLKLLHFIRTIFIYYLWIKRFIFENWYQSNMKRLKCFLFDEIYKLWKANKCSSFSFFSFLFFSFFLCVCQNLLYP